MTTAYLFLDTNVLLHYLPFDQIAWSQIVRAEEVVLVFSPVTLRELNKHKDTHHSRRIRQRAGAVLKKLNQLFRSESEVQFESGPIALHEDRDANIDYSKYHLSYAVQDDQLMATMIMHREQYGDRRLVLITADEGLILLGKARRQHFEVILLPDNLRIPEEADPVEEELKELKRAQRGEQVPKLFLCFQNGDKHMTYTLLPPIAFTPTNWQSELDEIKRQHPKMELPRGVTFEIKLGENDDDTLEGLRLNEEKFTSSMSAIAHMLGGYIEPQEVADYNEQLQRFYIHCEQYLQIKWSQNTNLRRTIQLIIELANDGTTPAEDIDVYLDFPDGVTLFDEHPYRVLPRSPKPPSRPTPRSSMVRLSDSVQIPSHILMNLARPADNDWHLDMGSNVSALNIEGTTVSFHVDRLKHRLHERAKNLYLVFDTYDRAGSFNIAYRILAANVSHEIAGQLHIVIDKSTSED
jgi:hypothetical protein